MLDPREMSKEERTKIYKNIFSRIRQGLDPDLMKQLRNGYHFWIEPFPVPNKRMNVPCSRIALKPPNLPAKKYGATEDFITRTGAKIWESNMAMYSMMYDCIIFPKHEKFITDDDYYQTLFHELIHWTDMLEDPKRLSRKWKGFIMEELIAESGSMILCFLFNINPTPNQSIYYIGERIAFGKITIDSLNDCFNPAVEAVEYLISLDARKQ